jgi:hypothetical protein
LKNFNRGSRESYKLSCQILEGSRMGRRSFRCAKNRDGPVCSVRDPKKLEPKRMPSEAAIVVAHTNAAQNRRGKQRHEELHEAYPQGRALGAAQPSKQGGQYRPANQDPVHGATLRKYHRAEREWQGIACPAKAQDSRKGAEKRPAGRPPVLLHPQQGRAHPRDTQQRSEPGCPSNCPISSTALVPAGAWTCRSVAG